MKYIEGTTGGKVTKCSKQHLMDEMMNWEKDEILHFFSLMYVEKSQLVEAVCDPDVVCLNQALWLDGYNLEVY